MCRKWKRISVLCLAALIGCLLPMHTMLAAEDGTGYVQGTQENMGSSVSDNNVATSGETDGIYDGASDGSSDAADGNIADGDEAGVVTEATPEKADAVVPTLRKMAAGAPNGGSPEIQLYAAGTAPEISIQYNGDVKQSLGGEISYVYSSQNQSFTIGLNGDKTGWTLSYYLDKVEGTPTAGKEESAMGTLSWTGASADSEQVPLSSDGGYVLYVKAQSSDGQIIYARSNGVVVDTTAPVITEAESGAALENGKEYPVGTKFRVEDAHLKSVTVNEQIATPAGDGTYQVQANGTSCVIKAEDQAGNHTSYSITVSDSVSSWDGTKISYGGTYHLTPGTQYQLGNNGLPGGGWWRVEGDDAIYAGDSAFYVKEEKDYRFTRYPFY